MSRALALLFFGLAACGKDAPADGEAEATPDASASAVVPVGGFVLPPKPAFDTNPLGLPPIADAVPDGTQVFAVPRRMLDGARPGSALALRVATVLERQGTDLVVRIGQGEPFPVHPAYVVVPRIGQLKLGTEVLTAWRGRPHHAVVRGLSGRDRVTARFIDIGQKTADQKLPIEGLGVLGPGLVPGAYAALREGDGWQHVVLVSSGVHGDGKTKWLALRDGGEAVIVDEDRLTRLPTTRFDPKSGEVVLAAWRGAMVPAKVADVDRPALYTVRREQLGPPLLLGAAEIMPVPAASARPTK